MAQPQNAEIEGLEDLAAIHQARLRVLERQIAAYGMAVPPHIVLDKQQTERELARVQAELRRLRPTGAGERAPYQGLRTFQERDADLFFGRAALVAELVARVERMAFLAVLGASGSGKSSVVQAGLLPELRGGALPESQHWHYAILKPGDRPLDALAAVLVHLLGAKFGDPLTLGERLAGNERALLLAADVLREGQDGIRLALVIDQAEELWTLAPADPEARTAFIEQQQRPFIRLLLAAAIGHSSTPPVLVILTLRADFLHRAAEHAGLARLISDHDIIVSPMTPDELRSAIVCPAEALGCAFEPGLAEELVRQAQGQPGALPLLEYTLLELWKARAPDSTLTWQAFEDLGGVEGALAARADAILAERYTAEQRERLRHLLLRLVQPGEGAADTRRRALLADLAPAGESVEQVQALLQPLVDERLLVITTTNSRDTVTRRQGDKVMDSEDAITVSPLHPVTLSGPPVVEVAHEALIRAWPTLGQWISEARSDLGFQLRLEEATKEWQAGGENEDFLWDGLRLANAEAWLERARPQLNAGEHRFLETSREAERAYKEAEEVAQRERESLLEARASADRRNAVRLRWFLGIVSVLLVVAVVVTIFAVDRQRAADEQARQARAGQANTLAVQSQLEDERLPQRRLLLALEAIRVTSVANELRTPAAEQALRDALAGIGRLGLHGHIGRVNAVAFSPDGRWALTGSDDGTARLWNIQADDSSTSVRVLRGHEAAVSAVAFSPDGRWVLTGSDDHTARLWDTQAADPSANSIVLRGHEGRVNAVAFSPDGRWVLTGSGDRLVQLSDGLAWEFIRSRDDTVRLWDTQADDPSTSVRELRGHEGTVNAVAFSPDGRWILTGSREGTARFWDIQADDPSASVRELRGHEGAVNAVAFSPDGRWVLTGSDDNTARLWDIQAAEPSASVKVLRGHTNGVTAVAFSPDGRWALTGSKGVRLVPDGDRWSLDEIRDDTARLWDTQADNPSASVRELRGHEGAVNAVAFSPDGRWVLTGSDDNTARLWDIQADDPSTSVRELRGHEGMVNAVAFSPDGRWVLTGSDDNTARLWDIQAVDLSVSSTVLLRHADAVIGAVFSADGRWILTGSTNWRARWLNMQMWNMQTKGPSASRAVLLEHVGPINAVAFSPDGHWALTSDIVGVVQLWDMQAADPSVSARDLRGYREPVNAVAFSPDGRWILTGSGGNISIKDTIVLSDNGADIIRLWDTQAADLSASMRELRGHKGGINAVAFSPDGRWVLIGSNDGTAQLWDIQAQDPSASVRELRGHEGAVNAVAFSPDGRWVLTGGGDSWPQTSGEATARLWDLRAVDPSASAIVLRGHEGGVYAVAFSPDGRWALTGGGDGTARLWDLRAVDPSASAIMLRGHKGAIHTVAFSPDGRWILTGSDDGTARLWHGRLDDLVALACHSVVRNLTWDEWQQYFPGQEYHTTCPDLPPHASFIDHLVQEGADIAKQGKIVDALVVYKDVQERYPAYAIGARSWDMLCRYGSVWGQANDVLDACEQSVKQAPGNGSFRDSRGLARALTGNFTGAIEDFNAYIAWAQERGMDDQIIAERKAWIAALEAGRNPFDAATLERLRRQ